MDILRDKKGFICDMDGVVYHGNRILPGVAEFVDWMRREGKEFLFLTNNSGKTPRELRFKMLGMGLDIEEDHFYTSAQATAKFLSAQTPGCRAYVIGEPGLVGALYEAGISISDQSPDYVVVGEAASYSYETVCRAVSLVLGGAKLIGTNSDLTGPSERGIIPACRALISPIELACGQSAYFVGKPNPLMMRSALRRINVHSDESVMIGDRMDTDIIAGIESGLDTVLVLSGVTQREDILKYPYRPRIVLNGVGDIPG